MHIKRINYTVLTAQRRTLIQTIHNTNGFLFVKSLQFRTDAYLQMRMKMKMKTMTFFQFYFC